YGSWRDQSNQGGVLRILKRNVILKASLAVVTVVLTIVLIFSLSVAWYTNVVQTGGLAFEAEEWKFDGKIELLMESSVQATPGDEGVIPVRITNGGDHIVAASATVVKSQMPPEMSKRLYFYVDTTMNRNQETVDRVFISEKSSYTYTIFPNSTLELSMSVKNGPLIKWMWVYDVLGYYVWGQQSGSTVEPLDYIRPVEYDYDPITTTFEDDGTLATVDGNKSVADFVTELTKSDGYAGTMDPEDEAVQAVDGYYPISVNEDGYGVWLYLCTREEIQANMQYDTTVGSDPNQAYMATLTITGRNSREDSVPVSSVQELQTVLNDPTVGIIRLENHLELTQTLSMTEGSAIIDLNDKVLSVGENVEKIIQLSEGAKLAIENGTLQGSGLTDAHAAATLVGGHLTMNHVTVTNVGTGVKIEDNNATLGNSSTVTLNNCQITADQQGVWVYGNPPGSTTRTKIVINGKSSIKGTNYAGILCSGNHGGTDITVSDSKIEGFYTAIYHPQVNSTLKVTDHSTLTGGTGLVVKGGTVLVEDSTVSGTMEGTEPANKQSGWSDTGDGIYLEANYAKEDAPVTVTVKNCNVFSDYAYAIRKFEADAPHATLTVESGTFFSFNATGAEAPENFDAVVYLKTYGHLANGSEAILSTVNGESDPTKCIVTAGAVTP
ncbi:MAG: hypothetical protein IJA91_04805, partial [Clostridia bacterium]|nr:hypothetical protein [Clostridia bacterium]